eukprot:2588667-Amphidinium_carterae.1
MNKDRSQKCYRRESPKALDLQGDAAEFSEFVVCAESHAGQVEAIGNQDTESGRTAMQMTTKVDVLARQ